MSLPYRCLLKPWVILSVLCIAIFVYFFGDRHVSLFFQPHLSDNFHGFDFVLNHIGEGIICIPLICFFMVYFKKIKPNPVWFYRLSFFLAIMILDHIFLAMFKYPLGRARPYLFIQQHIFGFYPLTFSYDYFSLPSGHTFVFMAIAGFFGLLCRPPYRYLVIGLGLLISFTRVWQNLHYLSDWFVTAYISLLMYPLGSFFMQKFLPQKYWQEIQRAMGFSQ